MRRMLERAQNWAMGPPTLAEALEERPQQTSRVDAQVIWGPITKEVASLAGMWVPTPTSTVLLQPRIPEELRQAALREVPDDVRPLPGDTASSLSTRLSRSTFLEDSHLLELYGRLRLDYLPPGRLNKRLAR